MAEQNCVSCRSVRREAAVRGRVMYRCFDPAGRLVDPSTGEPAGSTYGFTVDRPLPEGADVEALGIEAPEWCPRRHRSGKGVRI